MWPNPPFPNPHLPKKSLMENFIFVQYLVPLSLIVHWWWCIRIVEIFRANCWRVSSGYWEILHEFIWLTPRKPATTKVWRRHYCYQYLVTWNCSIIFWYIHLCKLTDDSKNDCGIVIIQPYQNERLKAYSTLLDILFISFIKDSNLQKNKGTGIYEFALHINFFTM